MSFQMNYTPMIVRNFFENYHEFLSYVEKGDPSYVEIWVDINDAIQGADITARDMRYLQECCILDNYYDFKSIAKKYGTSRYTVERGVRRALAGILNELTTNLYSFEDIKLRNYDERM
ncbi:hypothetical protein [Staphylococcus felis]|uniref:hypothetical protein n=1 Tax=Staphylococcus felis TaxID=46127 RepID=UPI000E236B23|nr:hypothetical protein [Staphylococcus felis]REI09519.1 hypothetical protein DOS69_01925 [Staphylococcus felis]